MSKVLIITNDTIFSNKMKRKIIKNTTTDITSVSCWKSFSPKRIEDVMHQDNVFDYLIIDGNSNPLRVINFSKVFRPKSILCALKSPGYTDEFKTKIVQAGVLLTELDFDQVFYSFKHYILGENPE